MRVPPDRDRVEDMEVELTAWPVVAVPDRRPGAVALRDQTLATWRALFMIGASVGHDGLLCELGYDRDGAGTHASGCG